ncbi:MAG: hypothetical protein IKY83_14295 [Proteobacteria bacterium]|nr:hypothetical protein [Pseudomonadota bacterium]
MSDEERREPVAEGGDASGADHSEAERSHSEAALDALDATPENRRRSALVLGIIGILFACAAVMVISTPPLSGQKSKDEDSHYHEIASVEVTAPGEGVQALAYAVVTHPLHYDLDVSQETRYEGGAVSRVGFRAGVTISRPERRHFEDEVTLKFSGIDVHVFDGDAEIGLSESGRMLEGIALYTRLTRHGGLLNVYPEAKINPQVGRVLYMVSDAMRGLWVPLPSDGVGSGGSYIVRDTGDGPARVIAVSPETLAAAGGAFVTALDVQAGGRKVGNGKGSFEIRDGILERSAYEIVRDGAVFEGGAASQTLSVSCVRRADKNM